MLPESSQGGGQFILDELVIVSESLTRLQRQVEELKQRYMQEIDSFKNEIAELKSENFQAINAAKWMKAQNEDLQARLGLVQPHVDNVTQTHELLERYRKAYHEIVYDNVQLANEKLLNALEEGLVTDSEDNDHQHRSKYVNEPRNRDATSQDTQTRINASSESDEERADIQEVHDQLLPSDLDSSSDNASPGPSGTRKISVQSVKFDESPNSDQSSSVLAVRSPAHSFERHSIDADSSISVSGTLPSEMIPEGESLPVQPVAGRKEEVWAIQFGKPPASHRVKCGPIRWTQMGDPRRVGLDNDTVASLQSLTLAPELELRLQIVDDLAFVHDPVFLEDRTTPASYLIDWGSKQSNQTLARYIATKGKATNSVFHTFVYVVKPKKLWFYVGAYTWTVTSVRKVWGSLMGQNRQKLLDRLHEHSQKQVNKDVIADMLDDGNLRQICVKLNGDDHVDISRAQCAKMNYSEPSKKNGNR